MNLPSIISKISLEDRVFYIKRDDLVDRYLSGNKFRKLFTLLQTPSNRYNHIISYGGSQSNAMLSIAALCHNKGWKFTYYTKKLSHTIKSQQNGNFYKALSLGMNHIELDNAVYRDFISTIRLNFDEKTYIIDQGGAGLDAEAGVKILSDEIISSNLKITQIATPSGTGTTAYFLAKNLPTYTIYTTPCVGDKNYLLNEMSALGEIPSNLIILEPSKKYHFAKPYKEFYEIYKKLLKTNIEFDLLYAPQMWLTLLEQTDGEILYIHSGGVYGNQTQLPRYYHLTKSI